jgi:hypothetical protein
MGIGNPTYGMPTEANGRPAGPTSHRGNPANGEYGSPRPKCVGDGVSGERIKVFYAWPANLSNNYNSDTVGFIRTKVDYANSYMYNSSNQYGQDIRWHCSNGTISVTQLPVVSTDGSDYRDLSITKIENALTQQGYPACRFGCDTHQSLSYLVMVDQSLTGSGTSANYCGLGWPGANAPDNKDRRDHRSGVVADVRCWTGHVVLHEIMHTQGSVLFTSPNSDQGHHCRGTADAMCTAYGSSEPSPTSPREQLDCGRTGTGGDSDGLALEPVGQRFKEDYWDPSGGQYFENANLNWLHPTP